MRPIRVLVADDAVVVRKLLTSVIDGDPDLEVVGGAANGAIALQKIAQLKPDIVTLDVEMPEMDGLQALRELRKVDRSTPVIMFSTVTERGAAATLEALTLGASDYVTKPANAGSAAAAMEAVRAQLIPRIKSLCRPALDGATPTGATSGARRDRSTAPVVSPSTRTLTSMATGRRIGVVAIGASTGGPMALSKVLSALPADLRVPVVVTQHMPPVFTKLLAQRLDASIAIEVKEAETGDQLRPGRVLIAPGDHHMGFRRTALAAEVVLDQGPPVNSCRPAVDVMYRSLAAHFPGDVLAVVLTGMGHDGRDGAATLRSAGARVIAQDQATSVVWGMPGAVVAAGLADWSLPIDEIGPRIATLVGGASSGRLAS